MTDKKRNLKKKIAAGAVLVALSGFVPKVTKPAHAATTTISASGTFSSGIQLTAGSDLQFGIIVATGPSGSVSVSPASVTGTSKAFFNGGVQKAGTIAFSAGATKTIDITVVGMKNTLTLGSLGTLKTGTVNLPTVKVTGPFAGTLSFTGASTAQTVALTNVTADLNLGGVVTWGGVLPIGTFATPITVTVSY